MLDTDMVSCLDRGKTPTLDARVAAVSPRHLCNSTVTRGELLYGLKLKDGAHRLTQLVDQFLLRVQRLPWERVQLIAEACAARRHVEVGVTER